VRKPVLPYSSSGIALFGMKTVQAYSCLNSEQNGTLFISVGGQEGGFGGWVVILGQRPKIWTCLSTIFFDAPCLSFQNKAMPPPEMTLVHCNRHFSIRCLCDPAQLSKRLTLAGFRARHDFSLAQGKLTYRIGGISPRTADISDPLAECREQFK